MLSCFGCSFWLPFLSHLSWTPLCFLHVVNFVCHFVIPLATVLVFLHDGIPFPSPLIPFLRTDSTLALDSCNVSLFMRFPTNPPFFLSPHKASCYHHLPLCPLPNGTLPSCGFTNFVLLLALFPCPTLNPHTFPRLPAPPSWFFFDIPVVVYFLRGPLANFWNVSFSLVRVLSKCLPWLSLFHCTIHCLLYFELTRFFHDELHDPNLFLPGWFLCFHFFARPLSSGPSLQPVTQLLFFCMNSGFHFFLQRFWTPPCSFFSDSCFPPSPPISTTFPHTDLVFFRVVCVEFFPPRRSEPSLAWHLPSFPLTCCFFPITNWLISTLTEIFPPKCLFFFFFLAFSLSSHPKNGVGFPFFIWNHNFPLGFPSPIFVCVSQLSRLPLSLFPFPPLRSCDFLPFKSALALQPPPLSSPLPNNPFFCVCLSPWCLATPCTV